MKLHSVYRICILSICTFVIVTLPTGCNAHEIATPTAVAPTMPLLPTKALSTSTPAVTLTPVATAPPTAIIPQPANRAMLVSVSGMIQSSPEEIWILDSGQTVPHPLLQSQQYSFETAIWSNSGEWIAFQRHDIAMPRGEHYQIGVVRKDGTEQHLVTEKEFPYSFLMNWSANDDWLTFTVITPQGDIPYALEVATGVLINLLPYSDVHYTNLWLQPSPQTDMAVLIGLLGEAPASQVEMRLVPLESGQESVRIPLEPWPDCEWFTGLTWSPDGTSFLVQPGNDVPTEKCPPRLWRYHLEKQEWSQVAQPPGDTPGYLYLRFVDWSPDHRWVAWSGIFGILVYDVSTWQVVREQKIHGGLISLEFPWVQDQAGNSILTLAEGDSAVPAQSFKIIGLSPNGPHQQGNDKILVEIVRDSKWLPDKKDYLPWVWQP